MVRHRILQNLRSNQIDFTRTMRCSAPNDQFFFFMSNAHSILWVRYAKAIKPASMAQKQTGTVVGHQSVPRKMMHVLSVMIKNLISVGPMPKK